MLDLSAVERQMALNEVSFPISTSTKYMSKSKYLNLHQVQKSQNLNEGFLSTSTK